MFTCPKDSHLHYMAQRTCFRQVVSTCVSYPGSYDVCEATEGGVVEVFCRQGYLFTKGQILEALKHTIYSFAVELKNIH